MIKAQIKGDVIPIKRYKLWLHFFGFHHWGKWSDEKEYGACSFKQERNCIICNKYQERIEW